ncbi:tyrosine protein phosphatase yvh1 [Xylographa opegraphella]|nr:tyrosine protein phosphatase yvh1 [Xylographa opegraphella]
MALDRIPGDAELYIGGLFSLRRSQALKNARITHVVSALRLPLDESLFQPYRHLVVELDDVDDEDVLQHFATSNAFIRDGLAGGGGVLVHCAMGKSRSTTLIIAHLLSLSPSTTTPASALATVRACRPMAEPNAGFMQQLELYHRIGCPADVAAHPLYQRWLYQREVERSIACGRAPDSIRFGDEEEGGAAPADDKGADEVEYRCRKCRRGLATSAYIIAHTPKAAAGTSRSRDSGPIATLQSPAATPAAAAQCAHLFLDPLSWMRPELELGKLDGRLECPNPKCRTNVGKYAWQGMRCSCGGWVVPGISLARGRVDEIKSRTKGLGERPGGKM